MIGDTAKRSFQNIFYRAVELRLKQRAADRCEIHPVPLDSAPPFADSEVIVITISSVVFRLLLLVQVKDTPEIRHYLCADKPDTPLKEVFMELANLCAGVMNQEMVPHFAELGMSTPYLLGGQCVNYLNELRPDYLERFAIVLNDTVSLCAVVCACADAAVDFTAEFDEAQADTAGELEMF